MFAACVAVLGSCNKKNDNTTVTEVAKKQQVRVESVYAEEVEQLYEYTAIVQAEAVNNIAPTLAGRIEAIYVEVGDPISRAELQAMGDTKAQASQMRRHYIEKYEQIANRIEQYV